MADQKKMAEAVAAFLRAAGVTAEAETPERVARAWAEDLLDGYARDPAAVLAQTIPAETSADFVMVTGLRFHAICPHHLLPYRGVAHVAYVPAGRVVGFGQLGQLVDALGHRLVLQEDLARGIVDALGSGLGAAGAACALEAEQLCMTVRGDEQDRSKTYAEAFVGTLATDAALRARFVQRIGK